MSSEELKPCPFCGSSELLGFEPSHEGGWTIVKCRKCGCSGSTGRSTSEQEATAFWNRRVTHHAPAEQVEVVAFDWATYLAVSNGWPEEVASLVEHLPDEPLMTVAQHERITAALAAELERLLAERDVEIERLHMDYNEACADAMEVARELTALKAQPALLDQGEVQRLREALEEIADPIKFMRARLEDGEQLNGVYAIQMADSGNYLREIAKRALTASTGQEVE